MRRWGFNYIFKFFWEYFYSYAVLVYIIYIRILDKYGNSPLLKQVWIILLTIVIFEGTLAIINKSFSKRDRNFKISNKHPFMTILKWFKTC